MPWYHLGSLGPSRSRPFRVQTHPRALTGASRRSLLSKQSATQLQDHVQQTILYLFPPAEALCHISVCLLFSSSSFPICTCRFLTLSLTVPLSVVNRHFFTEPSRISPLTQIISTKMICFTLFSASAHKYFRLSANYFQNHMKEVLTHESVYLQGLRLYL